MQISSHELQPVSDIEKEEEGYRCKQEEQEGWDHLIECEKCNAAEDVHENDRYE